MNFKTMTNKIIVFIILLFLFGCKISDKTDVYVENPINSELSVDVLIKSKQIFICDTTVILLYNFTDYNNVYNYHLLFYDKNLKLKSACYSPSNSIDSIVNRFVYCENSKNNIRQSKFYRNDLPDNYKFSYNSDTFIGKSWRTCNKIANNIFIEKDSLIITVKKSNDIYLGLDNQKRLKEPVFINHFYINDTLCYKINDISFFFDEKSIMIEKKEIDRLHRDYILVPDSIFISLYNQILTRKL